MTRERPETVTTIVHIAVLTTIIFTFFAALIWVMSSSVVARTFNWTMDHPVIAGVVFSVIVATWLVASH